MATSSEIFDEDIKFLKDSNDNLLLEIAAVITNKLTEKQEQLKQCKWTDGESNTDTDFSELADKLNRRLDRLRNYIKETRESIIFVRVEYNKINVVASYCLIPYILWLCFASYLAYYSYSNVN
jgi:predicted 2-oxoglutarate/Fe(II)-dependent dioxygenase YbiX